MSGEHSFDIKSAYDFYEKLQAEHASLGDEPLSSRHAINFAMTAWHLVEWIWWDLLEGCPSRTRSLGIDSHSECAFRQYVRRECPAIVCMEDIANGSKHCKRSTNRKSKKVARTEHHRGPFSSGFNRGFDISRLQVELDDGTVEWFEDLADRVLHYWDSLLPRIRPKDS